MFETESLLSRQEYLHANRLPLLGDGEVGYLIRCIEDEIPYLGLFDSIFSAEQPLLVPLSGGVKLVCRL